MKGYSIQGHGSLHVGHLPERRSPAIFVVRDGEITGIGYFRSIDDAEEVIEMLELIAASLYVKPDAP